MFNLVWCAARAAAMSSCRGAWGTRQVSDNLARNYGWRKLTDFRKLATSALDGAGRGVQLVSKS